MSAPTLLLVARHGDADYKAPGVLSNAGGWLSEQGREQSIDLAHAARRRGVSAVYCSRLQRSVETAQVIGEVLDLRPQPVEGLQEYAVGRLAGVGFNDPRAQRVLDAFAAGDLDAGFPGGEDGHALVARVSSALQRIADAHPGQTVVVITHGGVMSLVIPRLSDNVRDDLAARQFLPNCVPAEVEIREGRWQVLSWPGSTDKSRV